MAQGEGYYTCSKAKTPPEVTVRGLPQLIPVKHPLKGEGMGASTPEVHELFLQLEGLTESRIQVGECNVLSDELANIISEGLDHTIRFDWDNSADNFTGYPYFTSTWWEMRNQRDRKC